MSVESGDIHFLPDQNLSLQTEAALYESKQKSYVINLTSNDLREMGISINEDLCPPVILHENTPDYTKLTLELGQNCAIIAPSFIHLIAEHNGTILTYEESVEIAEQIGAEKLENTEIWLLGNAGDNMIELPVAGAGNNTLSIAANGRILSADLEAIESFANNSLVEIASFTPGQSSENSDTPAEDVISDMDSPVSTATPQEQLTPATPLPTLFPSETLSDIDAKQANKPTNRTLLGISALAILATGYLFFLRSGSKKDPRVSPYAGKNTGPGVFDELPADFRITPSGKDSSPQNGPPLYGRKPRTPLPRNYNRGKRGDDHRSQWN